MEDSQVDPLATHCFCVCSGGALLGDLLVVKQIHGPLSSLFPVDLSEGFLEYYLYRLLFLLHVHVC